LLEGPDFRLLARWCRQRRLQVLDLGARNGVMAMRLEPDAGTIPFARMLLVAGSDGFRLMDGEGEPLAAASDLPAVLDAVDGGVSEQLRASVA
jgi:hypothetical protein